MEPSGFLERIQREFGVNVSDHKDQYRLTGVFNQFRPNGLGLERIFRKSGEEGEVLARLKMVFDASASSWVSGDIYFLIRKCRAISDSEALSLGAKFLSEIRCLADFMGNKELSNFNANIEVAHEAKLAAQVDEDVSVLIYELVTDFLAKFQMEQNPVFLLKEAMYSLANDYFLVAFLLWPMVRKQAGFHCSFDAYFEMWRSGLKFDFSNGGVMVMRRGVGG